MADNQPAKIDVAGLTKSFDDNHVLRGIDLRVAKGESLVLFGTSGSGKSLLLKCIVGLIPPDSGSVKVDGEETTEYGAAQRTRFMDRIGVLFQYSGLFDSLRVWENIAFQLTHYRHMGAKQARQLAVEKLIAVGLTPDTADLYPSELSGGMQKRVGIARAISTNPEILFLDEPTSGLDPISAGDFDALIRTLQQTLEITVFMVTHDLESLYTACDRIAVLADGKVVADGPIATMLESEHPWVRTYFQGKRGGLLAERQISA